MENKYKNKLIGEEAFEVLKDVFASGLLMKNPMSMYTVNLLTLLNRKFNGIVGRYNFHLLKQSELQTIQNFVRALKRQVI